LAKKARLLKPVTLFFIAYASKPLKDFIYESNHAPEKAFFISSPVRANFCMF